MIRLAPERILLLHLDHPQGGEAAVFTTGIPSEDGRFDGTYLWPREDWEHHGSPTEITVMMLPGNRVNEVTLPGGEDDLRRRREQRAVALAAASRLNAQPSVVLDIATRYEQWIETGDPG